MKTYEELYKEELKLMPFDLRICLENSLQSPNLSYFIKTIVLLKYELELLKAVVEDHDNRIGFI